MTRHDPWLVLQHMLDACLDAQAFLGDRDADALAADRVHMAALERALTLIGEAATRLPAEVREAHPAIPWRDIIDFRNVLVHAYDTIDYELAVRVVRENIPALVLELEALLRER